MVAEYVRNRFLSRTFQIPHQDLTIINSLPSLGHLLIYQPIDNRLDGIYLPINIHPLDGLANAEKLVDIILKVLCLLSRAHLQNSRKHVS